MSRQMSRQNGRNTDKQLNRQNCRQFNRQISRQSGKQIRTQICKQPSKQKNKKPGYGRFLPKMATGRSFEQGWHQNRLQTRLQDRQFCDDNKNGMKQLGGQTNRQNGGLDGKSSQNSSHSSS